MTDQQKRPEQIWLELAELFFLDNEPTDTDFQRVAKLLIQNGWDNEQTFEFIIKHIAPKYGGNLGFMIYPIIGEWAAFNKEDLAKEVNRLITIRKKYPNWYFLLSDWWMKKMLKSLGYHKLEKHLKQNEYK